MARPKHNFQLQYVRCGKPTCKPCTSGAGHGPYWYEFWREDGRLQKQYHGKQIKEGSQKGPDVPKNRVTVPKKKRPILEGQIVTASNRTTFQLRADHAPELTELTKKALEVVQLPFLLLSLHRTAGAGHSKGLDPKQWLTEAKSAVQSLVGKLAHSNPSQHTLQPYKVTGWEYFRWTVRLVALTIGQILDPEYSLQGDWIMPMTQPSQQEEFTLTLVRALHRLYVSDPPADQTWKGIQPQVERAMSDVDAFIERLYQQECDQTQRLGQEDS